MLEEVQRDHRSLWWKQHLPNFHVGMQRAEEANVFGRHRLPIHSSASLRWMCVQREARWGSAKVRVGERGWRE